MCTGLVAVKKGKDEKKETLTERTINEINMLYIQLKLIERSAISGIYINYVSCSTATVIVVYPMGSMTKRDNAKKLGN